MKDEGVMEIVGITTNRVRVPCRVFELTGLNILNVTNIQHRRIFGNVTILQTVVLRQSPAWFELIAMSLSLGLAEVRKR